MILNVNFKIQLETRCGTQAPWKDTSENICIYDTNVLDGISCEKN